MYNGAELLTVLFSANLSKEYDTLEFIWKGKVKVKHSQGHKQSDDTDDYKQHNANSTTITTAEPEVKGCSIIPETISTQLAYTPLTHIFSPQQHKMFGVLTCSSCRTLLILGIKLELASRKCTEATAVEEAGYSISREDGTILSDANPKSILDDGWYQ